MVLLGIPTGLHTPSRWDCPSRHDGVGARGLSQVLPWICDVVARGARALDTGCLLSVSMELGHGCFTFGICLLSPDQISGLEQLQFLWICSASASGEAAALHPSPLDARWFPQLSEIRTACSGWEGWGGGVRASPLASSLLCTCSICLLATPCPGAYQKEGRMVGSSPGGMGDPPQPRL